MIAAGFFGTYTSHHPANRLLAAALRGAGLRVLTHHAPVWERRWTTGPMMPSARLLPGLALRYARAVLGLARERARLRAASLIVVGFGGQLDAMVARRIFPDRPILFAPLTTLTETFLEDRRTWQPHSLPGRLLAALDRRALAAADLVLVDTQAHAREIQERFAVPERRIAVWHLGADLEVFAPRPERETGALQVLFYGQYLPLHGVEAIADAASRIGPGRGIEFLLIGDGPERARVTARLDGLGHVRTLRWVPFAELGKLAADANVCLGIFGSTRKARLVVPTKVYQGAAAGRAVVTADTAAVREVFTPGENIAVCPPADGAALAEVVEGLGAAADARRRLGERAAALMAARFSTQAQARALKAILAERMALG